MKVRSQPLLFLLLALALLFAQQGAATHALGHLSDPPPAHSQQDKNLPHSPACDKCVVYAGMGSAIAGTGLHIPPATVATAPAEVALTDFLPQTAWPYRSRAPPHLV